MAVPIPIEKFMTNTIAFIHTSPSMIPIFQTLGKELLPGASTFNMVDESLLCDIIREGNLPPVTARRLVGHVISAEEAGANYIMVTCSSMGRAVEASRTMCAATVLRVDEAMAKKAVNTGNRIGVIATLPSTLEPTVALIKNVSEKNGKTIEILSEVVNGAFQAVISGDGAKHDALVGEALRRLAPKVDVIVLAQASIARVVDNLKPEGKPVPILSSPRLAVEDLARLISGA
jgi:Asp/Glu/hydantoin racemase